MSRFSFQIDNQATFVCAKPRTQLEVLRAKLFGRAHGEGRNLDAQMRTAPIRKKFGPARNAVAPRTPITWPTLTLPLEPMRSIPAPPVRAVVAPAPAAEDPSVELNQVEYKGYLISARQIAGGRWIATTIRIGGDAGDANGANLATQHVPSFTARCIAMANAELDIDEWEKAGLTGFRPEERRTASAGYV